MGIQPSDRRRRMVHDLELLSNSFVARRPSDREGLSGSGVGNTLPFGAKSKINSIVSVVLANLSQQMARLDSRNPCSLPTATVHVPPLLLRRRANKYRASASVAAEEGPKRNYRLNKTAHMRGQ